MKNRFTKKGRPNTQDTQDRCCRFAVQSKAIGILVTLLIASLLPGCRVGQLFDTISQIVDSNSVQALFSVPGERNVTVGETVSFLDETLGTIDAWEWDFDSDGTVDSTEQHPQYEYNNPGVYDVTLRVYSGSYVDEFIRTGYIQVFGSLTAAFSATPLAGTDSVDVDFTDTSTGDITDWEWDFDEDGTIDSTQQNPSHTFTVGQYDISLTVRNSITDDFATEVKSAYIRVWEGVVADYSVNPSSYELTNADDTVSVRFTNESDGDIAEYDLDYGDGTSHYITTSNWTTRDHIYSKGVHPSRLTVSGQLGEESYQDRTVTINGPPTAPNSVSGLALSRSSIQVTWNDRSNDESGFLLEYRKSGDSLWSTVSPNPGMNQESASITGLETDTVYQFRVAAYNIYGVPQYSSIASTSTLPIWDEESTTVDSGTALVPYDFELDPAGNPHFLLLRIETDSTISLIHLYKSGSSWLSEPIVDSGGAYYCGFFFEDDGDMHVAYLDIEGSYAIRYKKKNANGTWNSTETVASVSGLAWVDVAVCENSSGVETPHVLYYDDDAHNIVNAYKASGSWITTYYVQSLPSEYYRHGWMGVRADTVGNDVALAYGRTHHPDAGGFGYTDSLELRYSEQSTHVNETAFITYSLGALGDPRNAIPENIMAAMIAVDKFDTYDVPHLFYTDYNSYGIHWAYKPASTWITETVRDTTNELRHLSIAVDGESRPCIVYRDEATTDTYFSIRDGGNWNYVEDVPGTYGLLDTDSTGTIHMMYFIAPGTLYYRVRNPE